MQDSMYREMKKKQKKHMLKPDKAKKMLSEGKIRGKPITEKQKRYFGAVAGGHAKM